MHSDGCAEEGEESFSCLKSDEGVAGRGKKDETLVLTTPPSTKNGMMSVRLLSWCVGSAQNRHLPRKKKKHVFSYESPPPNSIVIRFEAVSQQSVSCSVLGEREEHPRERGRERLNEAVPALPDYIALGCLPRQASRFCCFFR